MKYIKKFEKEFNYISPENELYSAIFNHRNGNLKKLIDNISDIDFQRGIDGMTFLMCSTVDDNMFAFDLLVKAGADWNKTELDGWDFLEMIEPEKVRIIINKYPEEFKLYLAKKDANKYNL